MHSYIEKSTVQYMYKDVQYSILYQFHEAARGINVCNALKRAPREQRWKLHSKDLEISAAIQRN